MKSLLLLLLMASGLSAQEVGRWAMDGNPNDFYGRYNATTVGSVSYNSLTPTPLFGTACGRGWALGNYLTINKSVFTADTPQMADTGSIRFSILIGQNWWSGSWSKFKVWSFTNATANGYFEINSLASVYVQLPCSSGTAAGYFYPKIPIRPGRWITYTLAWQPGTMTLTTQDPVELRYDIQTMAIGTPAVVPTSDVFLMRDNPYTTVRDYALDDVEFWNSAETYGTRADNGPMAWMQIGNSIVYGAVDVGVYQEGWRDAFMNYMGATYLKPWFWVGQTIYGSILCPFTDGINGATTQTFSKSFDSLMRANFPSPSSRCGIFFGTAIVCNDAYYSLTPTATKANLTAFFEAAHAYNPSIKMVVSDEVTANPKGSSNIWPYKWALWEAYSEARARGRNIYYYDPGMYNASVIDPAYLHPTESGYRALGRLIGENTYQLLTAGPQPTVAPPTSTLPAGEYPSTLSESDL